MNRVELSGNLTNDPELRWLGQGERRFPIATINVAVENAYGRWNRDSGKTEVDSGFYRVEVPGDHGLDVMEQASKGDRVYVLGSLTQYTGKDEKSHTQVRAELVTVMPRGRPRAQTPPPFDDSDSDPF